MNRLSRKGSLLLLSAIFFFLLGFSPGSVAQDSHTSKLVEGAPRDRGSNSRWRSGLNESIASRSARANWLGSWCSGRSLPLRETRLTSMFSC